jgi:hypothetical protein
VAKVKDVVALLLTQEQDAEFLATDSSAKIDGETFEECFEGFSREELMSTGRDVHVFVVEGVVCLLDQSRVPAVTAHATPREVGEGREKGRYVANSVYVREIVEQAEAGQVFRVIDAATRVPIDPPQFWFPQIGVWFRSDDGHVSTDSTRNFDYCYLVGDGLFHAREAVRRVFPS